MLDLAIACRERHEQFIRRVARTKVVWGLKSQGGWATCPSNEEDNNGKTADVLVFWSDRAYAQRCVVEGWEQYEAEEIPLDEFIDRWLPGMAGDGVLAGTNWTAKLIGLEVDPLTLGDELIAELKKAPATQKEADP